MSPAGCEVLDLGLVEYSVGSRIQADILEKVKSGLKENALIFAEFFPVYTVGRKGSSDNLLVSLDFLKEAGIGYCNIGRGGDITAHSPGQIVVYPIFDLSRFSAEGGSALPAFGGRGGKKDINWYLRSLEEVIIKTLLKYGIYSGRKKGLTGVWVEEKKIASIGISVSRWVTYHGLSLNANNNLSYFDFINPCGIKNCEVNSVSKLKGGAVDINKLKKEIIRQFEAVFGIKTYAGITASAFAKDAIQCR